MKRTKKKARRPPTKRQYKALRRRVAELERLMGETSERLTALEEGARHA